MSQSPRLPWKSLVPNAYQAMASVSASVAGSTLGKLLTDLVQTRVSQINGCAYCVDSHVRDLRAGGETWQRINSLVTWREVGLYSARERAVLDWAERLTRISQSHDDHDVSFDVLKTQFSDQEIAELTVVIAQINAWNRMGVGMHLLVADKPIE